MAIFNGSYLFQTIILGIQPLIFGGVLWKDGGWIPVHREVELSQPNLQDIKGMTPNVILLKHSFSTTLATQYGNDLI